MNKTCDECAYYHEGLCYCHPPTPGLVYVQWDKRWKLERDMRPLVYYDDLACSEFKGADNESA